MILEALKAYVEEGIALDLKVLSEEAKKRFKTSAPGELTKEAIKEAKDHNFDPKRYKQILSKLRTGNPQIVTMLKRDYELGIIDLDKLFEERAVQRLAGLYDDYGAQMSIHKLLLLNPGTEYIEKDEHGTDISFQTKTTFAHQLFAQKSSKGSIVEFFYKLDGLAMHNPTLLQNYLNLSDQNGVTITALLERESIYTAAYQNIEQDIKRECRSLYPAPARAMVNQAREVVNQTITGINTHTNSVHGSVDESLSKLALVYDPKLVNATSKHAVAVNRTAEWNNGIQKQLDELQEILKETLISNEKIDAFIQPTLSTGDNIEHERAKFKFQAETALRLIDGLNKGGYHASYRVTSDEPLSCGLTPKEVVAIGYASLKNRDLWNNPEQERQQLIQLIEHLYIAKRGYNIDAKGDNEWQTHGGDADNNKCTGGTVNEVAYGLTDHTMVEVKVITTETMAPSLIKILPTVLIELVKKDGENIKFINEWLQNSLIDSNLTNKIIASLQGDKEFSKEFSPSEIKSMGKQVLNKLKTAQVKTIIDEVKREVPELFLENNPLATAVEPIDSFAFDADKGYVLHLEKLYHENQGSFDNALQAVLRRSISAEELSNRNDARKANLMLELLLASEDKAMSATVAEALKAHLENPENNFTQAAKDQCFILSVETNKIGIVRILLDAGANVNATDNRRGYGGKTAMHIAAINGYTELANLLIPKMSDKSLAAQTTYTYKDTALFLAIQEKHFEIAKALISRIPKEDLVTQRGNGVTPLHMMTYRNNLEIANLLLNKAPKILAVQNDKGETPLHTAVLLGNVEMATLLTKNMTAEEVSAKDKAGHTALHTAIDMRNIEIATMLIKHNVAPVVLDLRAALRSHNIEMATLFIENMTAENISSKGMHEYQTLHFATYNPKIVKLLLDKIPKTEIAMQNEYGWTALHLAIFQGHTEAANLLLKKMEKKDINTRNKNGQTALDIAKEKGNTEIVEAIKNWKTPEEQLLQGAQDNNIEEVKTAIWRGADINTTYRFRGDNALILWAKNPSPDPEIAKLLVEKDADVNHKNILKEDVLSILSNRKVLTPALNYAINILSDHQASKSAVDTKPAEAVKTQHKRGIQWLNYRKMTSKELGDNFLI